MIRRSVKMPQMIAAKVMSKAGQLQFTSGGAVRRVYSISTM